jgi:hypothetical protein
VDESWLEMAVHVFKERVYPTDPQVIARLEGTVNWAYDIFTEKISMPPSFFDGSGNLLLPSNYVGIIVIIQR